MVNSRSLNDLREDVRVNCELFLKICKDNGLNVLITQTLRDDEYQAQLYAQGRTKPGSIVTNSKTTTFHGKGLAFDFCRNVKGHEYDDVAFFVKCGKIAKEIGFSWGGDWKSFPDRPHIQWDNAGKVSGTDIRNGKLPPKMPREEVMTREEVIKIIEEHEAAKAKKSASVWAKASWDKAKKKGIVDGSAPLSDATREQLAIILDRLNLL